MIFIRQTLFFIQLQKLQLHQSKPTYTDTIPSDLPPNTKAVIVSVLCNFRNRNGHANLNGTIRQKGNVDGGVVKIFNQHFNAYANTWYNEFLVPWDPSATNELELKVTGSYLTGGSDNLYRLQIAGYITA